MGEQDSYHQELGDNDQVEQRSCTELPHIEDTAYRKKMQNRIAQRAYRKATDLGLPVTTH
jgi:hypothetical protein